MPRGEYRIPTLNEKPTTKEILKAIPFVVRFIFSVAPGHFSFWILLLMIQVPSYSLSVFSTKHIIDAVASHDIDALHIWLPLFVASLIAISMIGVLTDIFDDLVRMKLDYAKEERAIELISSLPFSILERSEFRLLADAYFRKHYLILNINQWTFWMMFFIASFFGYAAVVSFLPLGVICLLIAAIVIRFVITQFEAEWNWGLLDQENREGRRAVYMRNSLTYPWTILHVKAINLHIPFVQQWKKLVGGILMARLKGVWKFSISWGAVEAIYIVSFVVAIYMLLGRVTAGTMTIGAFTTFIGTYALMWKAVGNATNNFRMIRRDASFLVLIRDFFSLQSETDKGVKLPSEPLRIRFEEVWFRYPGSKEDVLRGVTFEFDEGDRIALVGLNGAGKSTILKLLMGIFHPTKGRILINGVDLSKIRPSAWRRGLSVLSQDVPRFDDTIENQILYGDFEKEKNEVRLERSIQASGLGDVLPEMKKGIRTHAGKNFSMPEDEAIELSGGQNQIVGIARALYRDARMYIFDEPTSAVDPEKEENFFRSLPDVLAGKGIIFVSHRFSTLRQAEHIIVIDNGCVIEEGSHDELMFKQGRYAELFTLQAKAYQ